MIRLYTTRLRLTRRINECEPGRRSVQSQNTHLMRMMVFTKPFSECVRRRGLHSLPYLQGSDNRVIDSAKVLRTEADDVNKIAPLSKKGVHVLNVSVDPAAFRHPAMLALINLLQESTPVKILPEPKVGTCKL